MCFDRSKTAVEKLQAQNPDFRMELVEGKIIVMSPSGYESEEVATRVATFMNTWVMPRKIGRVAGSNAGFNVPDLGVRAPDVSKEILSIFLGSY